MKILAITARNYRIHRDITVELDPSRNLIGGPNESGKSTLVEAMHRALFLRARTSGNVQKSMCSDIHMGKPEVSLVFESGGQVWTVEKRFSGNSGTTRLTSDAGASLHGDEAETKLAQIIRNTEGSTHTLNQLENRWAHLWIWQGKAGDHAAVHAAQLTDMLVTRLQQDGLAAVMQSDFDQQVRGNIQTSYDGIFTKTGKPIAGSMLDTASKTLAGIQADLAHAESQAGRLEAAVSEQNAAAAVLAEAADALPGLREKQASVTESLARVKELRAQEEKEALHHLSASQTLEQLAAAHQQILDLRNQAAKAMAALLPAEAKLSLLAEQETSILELSALAESAHRAISEEVRSARLQNDLAAACISHFEKSAVCEALDAKTKDVAAIHESLTTDREALAKLPAISQPDLESLRKLDGQLRQAQSALAAIAARIELVSSELAIQLDGTPMAPGESRVITEAAELTMDNGTRLRIQPGGGTSLAAARQKVDDSRVKLTRLLDQLTVGTLAEASEIAARRQVLDQHLATIHAKLQVLGAVHLPAELSAATTARETAAAEVARRRCAIPEDLAPNLADSPAAARAWQTQTHATLDESERRERTARQDADARRASYQQAAKTHQSQRETTETARQKFNQVNITAAALEANYGDDPTRMLALEKALQSATHAKTSHDATLRALAELNPETLEADQTRFARSITRQEEKQREAETQIAVTRNVLALDGSQDPEADLVRARARMATAQQEHAREGRRAQAIALLHQLFSESQSSISEQVTQPIAERISGYLERIFDPGVRAVLELTDHGAQMLRLIRPGTPAFTFDALSGGTKEQVAAAVRLAMAEILAADHGGCLPLVFDDAFAFADPERVQTLQSMLDLAAIRGLQVIVLTCTPSDYIALGAKEMRLSRPMLKSALTAQASQTLSDPDNDEAPTIL